MSPSPQQRYADSVTVIVRYTPEHMAVDPDYEVATVLVLDPGGEVQAEEIEGEVLEWLMEEAGGSVHNEYAVERRHINVGASGAEAIILLGILSGVAGGVAQGLTDRAANFIHERLSARSAHVEPLEHQLQGVDGKRFATARAFDIRPSDLRLVEQRSSRLHDAAVFEDTAGRFYGVRSESRGAVTIRRLQPGDW